MLCSSPPELGIISELRPRTQTDEGQVACFIIKIIGKCDSKCVANRFNNSPVS